MNQSTKYLVNQSAKFQVPYDHQGTSGARSPRRLGAQALDDGLSAHLRIRYKDLPGQNRPWDARDGRFAV